MKKVFEGNVDELVHQQFQKFSRGEFPGRAMVRVKNIKGKYTVATTAEYAKDLIMIFAEKLGDERTMVSGAVVSALDLEGFDYKEKKMAMGARKYIIESEMSGNEILELCNKVEKAFFGLSFKVGEDDLKIQPKSPKSAKGAGSEKKEGKKAKIDFCKFKTHDEGIVRGLIFDEEIKDFKNFEVQHNFVINEIVMSDELKEECKNDFSKLREMAKRKGKVIRKIVVDDKEIVKEAEFES
jgi:hypothetical protein